CAVQPPENQNLVFIRQETSRSVNSSVFLLFQYFPILTAPLIALISLAWLVTDIFYTNTPCALAYNCMEMPSAVFCSLLAGISAVIEIHYSIDFNNLEWSQKWSWADSVALCFIHAVLAFALQ
ncbi:unnamed protein product, partial [Angiostrongylus costaricensis]|uniref:MARVEL domain-containing protein n=1 Tax=Angiostrongylus costaricensis TaxID=334426 RepID=A0A0R3PCG3_ANGCS